MDRSFPTVCAALFALLAVVLALLVTTPAHANTDRHATIDIAFPVAGSVTFSDDYDAPRDDGDRRHQATDIFGVKGQPVHAAVDGHICFAPGIDGPEPGYGYVLRICRGNQVVGYHHLNNDSPGTDDDAGGHTAAYAPGIREGVRVTRGQLIGYMGDSGNAEDTAVHLHFAIFDTDLVDPAIATHPWRAHYRNPYASLLAAQARGDVPALGAPAGAAGNLLRLGDRGDAVLEWQADLNAASGTGLTVDGVFGPATHAATVAFQEREGLDPDGIVGPASLAAMGRVLGGPAATTTPVSGSVGTAFQGRVLRLEQPNMRGEDVRAWQQRMQNRGWRGSDGAALAVDGIFGPDSARAARLFQEEKGLVVDGLVGPATWAAAFATAT